MTAYSPITPNDLVTMYYDATPILTDPHTGNATTIVGNATVVATLAANAAAECDLIISGVENDPTGITFKATGGTPTVKYNLLFSFTTSGGDELHRTEVIAVKASL